MTASRSRPINRRRNQALGYRATRSETVEPAESPGSARRLTIDQGRERIDRLATPQIVDVDRDVVAVEQAAQSSRADQPGCRRARTGRRETKEDEGP